MARSALWVDEPGSQWENQLEVLFCACCVNSISAGDEACADPAPS